LTVRTLHSVIRLIRMPGGKYAIERDSGGWGASDTQSLLPGICLLFRSVVFVVFQKQGSFYTKTTC
jgi:hypothetical protein